MEETPEQEKAAAERGKRGLEYSSLVAVIAMVLAPLGAGIYFIRMLLTVSDACAVQTETCGEIHVIRGLLQIICWLGFSILISRLVCMRILSKMGAKRIQPDLYARHLFQAKIGGVTLLMGLLALAVVHFLL